MRSATGTTSSLGSTLCSITDMSRLTGNPPLKAGIGVVMSSGSSSIDLPRDGRPVVIANRIPAVPRQRTALIARSVSTLSRRHQRTVDVGEQHPDNRALHGILPLGRCGAAGQVQPEAGSGGQQV
jgi:hypothetical protein